MDKPKPAGAPGDLIDEKTKEDAEKEAAEALAADAAEDAALETAAELAAIEEQKDKADRSEKAAAAAAAQERAKRAPKRGDTIVCYYGANGGETRTTRGRVTKLPKKGATELEAEVTISDKTSRILFSPVGTMGAAFTWRNLTAKEDPA